MEFGFRMKKKLLILFTTLLVIILLKIFVITPVIVKGNSMEKTLQSGNVALLYKFGDISRGKLVVVEIDDKKMVKRVIGLPGEKIKCVFGEIYINDKRITEKYISSSNVDFKEEKIKENEYFIMGDNRINSKDSRQIGTVNKNEILGTVEYKIFPKIIKLK